MGLRINKIVNGYVKKISKEDDLQSKLIDYLASNPNPDDDSVHDWAEKEGLDIHEVEAEMYKLATQMVLFLSGGKYVDSGEDISDDDPQVIKGIEVEYEHLNKKMDPEIAKMIAARIAKDHIIESKEYYDRLPEFEDSLKKN